MTTNKPHSCNDPGCPAPSHDYPDGVEPAPSPRGPAPTGNGHIVEGEFQSDKYPTTPRGKVPLSVKDATAQDLLWEYAQRRRSVDAGFSADLEWALRQAGHVPGVGVPARASCGHVAYRNGVMCVDDHCTNAAYQVAAPTAQGPAPTPPARLEELLTGIRERRANLGAHDCAGFDCATCEPSRDMEELDEVIDMVTGRNVE